MTGTITSRLDALFAPRGVAVVGASADPTKLGAAMIRSLGRFTGPVAGVNPRDPDPGANRYASVAQAAAALGPLDLAVLCVPAGASPAALAAAADGGVRAAVVCGGGFAEAGAEGSRSQAALADAARAGGVAVLGPNTSGFLAPPRGLWASFVPGVADVRAGPVAVVAASGGVNHVLSYLLAEAGVGVHLAVGLGNAADVGAPEVLEYLAADDACRVVVLHVESVSDGPALLAAVRATAVRMPVVALVVGRSDVGDFARSHTGALATSWRTTRAALRQAGAVVVDDERTLVDAAVTFAAVRLPPLRRPGVGVVTAQAGPGLLHVDALRCADVDVPELSTATRERLADLLPPMTFQANPVDTGRPGRGFGDVLRAVAADPGVDLVSAYALLEPDALDLTAAVDGLAVPVVVGIGGSPDAVRAQRAELLAKGVPVLAGPAGLSAAVTALVADARAAAANAVPDEAVRLPAGLSLPPGPTDEAAAKDLLAALGIATPPRRACPDRAAAHRALAELPGPVAVKLLDAAVSHKSEANGVHLGVRTPQDLDRALDALAAAGHRRFLVEAMAGPGVDLIAGARRDPVFGPVVLLGVGGVAAEALADVAVAVAPVGPARAGALAGDLAARPLLDGFRDLPAVDRTALGTVLSTLGTLLVTHPEIATIEINPLRATADGLVALDALLELTAAAEEPRWP